MSFQDLEIVGEFSRSATGRVMLFRGTFPVDYKEASPHIVVGYAKADDSPEAARRRAWKRGVRIPVGDLAALVELLNGARP